VRCHNIAIAGRDACLNHVGEGLDLAKAKGQALLSAWRADPGAAASVDPSWAVMAQLHVAVLRASLYGQLLERQVAREGGADPEAEGPGGLVGHVYAAGRAGERVATSEATRGLAVLEAQERDRIVRFAKTAHDMGIAEAQIRLAEQQGQLLASGLGWFLAELHLEEDARARELLGVMLRALAEGRAPQAIEGSVL
jgi:hypothetical protein